MNDSSPDHGVTVQDGQPADLRRVAPVRGGGDRLARVGNAERERRFAAWRMGGGNLNRINTGLILRYCEQPVLDPFQLSGAACAALLEELVTTGAITIRD